ncbi:MAG: ribose-phosphate pyrophosphokinase [Candidatus Magasanikbacteria bacterium]|nr:ribose-phosphate pyrophosphokinase [Candidatus Magasanikbacteria bacterium]
MDHDQNGFNLNGGLTLMPMPCFGPLVDELKTRIEAKTERRTPIDIAEPILSLHANNEPRIKLGKNHIGGHDVVVIATGPGTYEMIVQLLFVLGQLRARRPRRMALVLGYMPLCRSDKDEKDQELALASHMVRLILAAAYNKLDRIIVPDLHSSQAVQAAEMGVMTEVTLGRRVLQRAIEDARREYPDRKICVLFPDNGANNRYSNSFQEICERIEVTLPGVCGLKQRWDSNRSKLLGLVGETEALRDAIVISIDDEIATGGTNINTAIEVKKNYGAFQYWAGAAHGVLCGDAPTLFADPGCAVDKLYFTDTIPFHTRPHLDPMRHKVTVVPWANDLAQIIYHHHWDESIREMR